METDERVMGLLLGSVALLIAAFALLSGEWLPGVGWFVGGSLCYRGSLER